jgi:hypothetical protein
MDTEDIGDGPLFADEWGEWGRNRREVSPGRRYVQAELAVQEFVKILMQDVYWNSWDGEARKFRNIEIRDMDREHAKNALRWLRRHAKEVRKRVNRTDPKMMFGLGIVSSPREVIKSLPVYQALKNRVACPPDQKFNRAELKYLRDVFAHSLSEDDLRAHDAGSSLEATIRNKCLVYLED